MNDVVVQSEAKRVQNPVPAEPRESGRRRIPPTVWRVGLPLLLLLALLPAVGGCVHERYESDRGMDRQRYDEGRHDEHRDADRRFEDRGER